LLKAFTLAFTAAAHSGLFVPVLASKKGPRAPITIVFLAPPPPPPCAPVSADAAETVSPATSTPAQSAAATRTPL
jgi:hypothetical protein